MFGDIYLQTTKRVLKPKSAPSQPPLDENELQKLKDFNSVKYPRYAVTYDTFMFPTKGLKCGIYWINMTVVNTSFLI